MIMVSPAVMVPPAPAIIVGTIDAVIPTAIPAISRPPAIIKARVPSIIPGSVEGIVGIIERIVEWVTPRAKPIIAITYTPSHTRCITPVRTNNQIHGRSIVIVKFNQVGIIASDHDIGIVKTLDTLSFRKYHIIINIR
jgi:hypothetical protein